MEENYEDEMYLITFTTVPNGLSKCQSPLCKNRVYKWYYDQIKDILERNDQKRRVKQDGN